MSLCCPIWVCRTELFIKRLLISVPDDGIGMEETVLEQLNNRLGKGGIVNSKPKEESQGGVALVNVDNRIRLLFGEEYGLHVYSMVGLGTTVEIMLPCILNDWDVKNPEALQCGNIYYREELINTWRAAAPRYNRIGVIQSSSCLVEGLTVEDNIFVLRPAFKSWLIRPKLLRQQLQPILDKFDPNLSGGAYVEDLTHFQRFVVELVKAVVAGCRLIILREVSTFISDLELSRLQDILRYYAGEGLSFLYLGHHCEELTQICDQTALFSNGRIVKILEHEWIGAPASFDNIVRRQLERYHDRAGLPPVLEVEELSGGTIDKLTFSVAPGECVVLQDLQNRIFRDLVGLFMGDVPIRAGAIRLSGVPYRPGQNRQIAVIVERPDHSMIFSQLSYLDNLGITLDHRLPELWLSRRVQWGLRQECENKLGTEVFDLPPGKLLTQQKYDLVYRRILLQNPKVVFCIQPFQGADMEMRIHIWKLLEQVLEKGIALVILAINLADSLSLASRLIRIRQDAPPEPYEQSEFGCVPFIAPWLDLYRGPSPP